ncbi:MAG TPA: cytochrome c-type biogenesis CcmF C-terminal domain-containing protein, partial [Solirubrobacteraceae bacterium]|nr:cytochrome c-type biogenesis CcmF C-terminal domain-containing protein [Solirubrobacteraceae bacterium]
LAAVGQELWRGVRARRAMSRDSLPAAVLAVIRRNRRRYGGYIVHAGIAVLFVGIAASSAFQDQRLVQLRPGQTERVDGYAIAYEGPTARLVAADNGRLERIDLGARLRVRRGDGEAETLHTYKSYFPSTDPSLGPISRFFEGEATSEVGLLAGWRQDVWTAISPDVARLREQVEEGDRVFSRIADLPAEAREPLLAQALDGLAGSYARNPPPATFRMIASPLVTWIWVGAIVVFIGGLVCLWPSRTAAPRPVAAAYTARVARELTRA